MAPISRDPPRALGYDKRGLVYFKTYDEFKDWDAKDVVDPLQIANTPLLKRPDLPTSTGATNTSNVLLMHDYRGGYLEYEGSQGAVISTEDYTCEYWQHVEIFNYFTHKCISIPPPSLINAGHRNGVLVLGTFMKEGGLEKENNFIIQNGYPLADILARMAAAYGFDGWFINIELKDPSTYRSFDVEENIWNGGNALAGFLKDLRTKLKQLVPSGGKVIWYDSVTKGNYLQYQNTLNNDNVLFAKAADSIATNYFWTSKEKILSEDGALATAKDNIDLNKVYIGTDCWSQTNDGRDERKYYERPTYGVDMVGDNTKESSDVGTGHGGTATGLGVRLPAQYRLSSGLFGHGWAYEHLLNYGGGKSLDRFMWEGRPFLKEVEDLKCKCRDSINRHLRSDLKDNPITKFATQFPAGSEAFFYTDYKNAIYELKPGMFQAHLGQRSILPAPGERSAKLNLTPVCKADGKLVAYFENEPARCSIHTEIAAASFLKAGSQVVGKLTLHKLNARTDLGLSLTIKYQRLAKLPQLKVSIFVETGGKTVSKELPGQALESGQLLKPDTLIWSLDDQKAQITAVGILIEGPANIDYEMQSIAGEGATGIVDIFEMSLKPADKSYPTNLKIENVKFKLWGADATAHYRLAWSSPAFKDKSPSPWLPWSAVTGPFSYFYIKVGDQELGRAYAQEFVIESNIYNAWKADKKSSVAVTIAGYAFDGTLAGKYEGNVQLV